VTVVTTACRSFRGGESVTAAGFNQEPAPDARVDGIASRRGIRMKHRIGALVLLAVGSLPASPAPAAESQARFTVAVSVPSRVTLVALDQPAQLTLSDEDVRRGFKDVDASYTVSNNDPRGYLLRLSPRVGLTSRVQVTGLATDVVLADTDVEVRQMAARGSQELALGFRLLLDPAARPGSYRWPLSLTATPL
jgi:hypothetical protein